MTVEDWLGKDNQIGIDIWQKKYRHNNESFDEWLDRVSGGDSKIRQLIKQKKFLFGGRILANRGLNKEGEHVTYSNCYVISPPEDTIESIFECATKLARTYSYGGGCGIDISQLAPRGAKVNNTAKETSGAVSFMDLYSMVTGLIGQNGRRGALMISLDCHHPDLEEFIEIKSDLNRVTKANISIRITDDFMQAVKDDMDFELSYTREATKETITKTVRAKELFHRIAEMNWRTAEPGMLFWDRITEYNLLNTTPEFEFAGVNPCAEEPLPAGGSCLLGSINLSEFVLNPFTERAEFDYNSFTSAIDIAVFAMNDILDEGLNLHPLQEQKNSVSDWRQIGLGIMGLADTLIKLGIVYGSEDAIKWSDKVGKIMAVSALNASGRFSQQYGKWVKCSDNMKKSSFYKNNHIIFENAPSHFANSQLLTIAPTGTLSTMLGISGGIEPIFANSYSRKTESLHGADVYYKVYTPIVESYMQQHGLNDDTKLPEYFVTAQDIDYECRIAMQAAWQKHIDASISSTVNVPNDFTIGDVENLYIDAWKAGLKGITIYRSGCEREGILTREAKAEQTLESNELKRGDIIDANDDVIGLKRKIVTGCGSLHCTAFFDPITGDLMETYFSKGSSGGCNSFMIGLSRMISLAARSGTNLYSIVDQLNSCGVCPSYATRRAVSHDVSKGTCCPMAIGNALIDMWKDMQDRLICDEGNNTDDIHSKDAISSSSTCPECGEPLNFEGGCNTCKSCGWSKCS